MRLLVHSGWRALAALALLSACGGRVEQRPEDGGVEDAAVDARPGDGELDAADGVSAEELCAPSGVRVCGAGCATTSADCPGLGCLRLVGGAGTLELGVCLADLPVPLEQCGLCADGEVCVHLEKQGYLCVAESVCRALDRLGGAAGCSYADFTPYDGRPLAVSRGKDCPRGSCGPGCGDCSQSTVGRWCSGRSASAGYGMCLPSNTFMGELCNAHEPLPSLLCRHCVVWRGSEAALAYGTCTLSDDVCPIYEASGRLVCYE